MSFTDITTPHSALRQLIAQGQSQMAKNPDPIRWLLVDVTTQKLIFLERETARGYWPISTAASGLDNRLDSGGTPPGLHRIDQKIGAGCPLGTVFEGRKPNGSIWRPDQVQTTADLILTRILTLDGCVPGLNRGADIDSRRRYIYLHGTNAEDRIGQPVSHGCIRLRNTDIIDLYDRVEEGDPVVIV